MNLREVHLDIESLLNGLYYNHYADSKFDIIVRRLQNIDCSDELKSYAKDLNVKLQKVDLNYGFKDKPNLNALNKYFSIIRGWR